MNTLFANISSSLKAAGSKLRRSQIGATAVEYGIMVSLIAVVIIVAVSALGGGLTDTFTKVSCQVSGKTYVAAVPAAGTTPATASSCS